MTGWLKYLIAYLLGAATVWGGIWVYTWAVLESFEGFDQHDEE